MSHKVWPCSVRHDGSCWLIAAPSCQPLENPLTNNSISVGSFRTKLPERKSNTVICFTNDFGALPYINEMAQKTSPSSEPEHSDVRTDYALIAIAAGAAILALLYLILI